MGMFSKTKPAPKGYKPQAFNFDQMRLFLGIPQGYGLHDGCLFRMWMPATPFIKGLDPELYHTVDIFNKGNRVVVNYGGERIGDIDPKCLGTAAEIFEQYGGVTAAAVITISGTGHTCSVYVKDKNWKPEN